MPVPPGPRVPPRFVPTLTEVVREGAPPRAEQAVPPKPTPASIAPMPSAPAAARPAFPPVPPTPVHVPKSPAALPVERAAQAVLSKDFEELLVHRVMQRVDVSLDIRLRGAIAAVVEEQTRSIVPRLREEIEAVVRHAVYEAVADELAAGVGTPAA